MLSKNRFFYFLKITLYPAFFLGLCVGFLALLMQYHIVTGIASFFALAIIYLILSLIFHQFEALAESLFRSNKQDYEGKFELKFRWRRLFGILMSLCLLGSILLLIPEPTYPWLFLTLLSTSTVCAVISDRIGSNIQKDIKAHRAKVAEEVFQNLTNIH